MIINNNSFSNINSIQQTDKNKSTLRLKSGLTRDVFQKTTPSFKGINEDNIFDFLIDSTMAFFERATQSLLDGIDDILMQTKREAEVSIYLEAVSSKNVKKLLLARKTDKVSTLNDSVFYGLGFDIDYINNLFEQSNIKTIMGLSNFIRLYTSKPEIKKIFKGQEIEAVKIFGLLGAKEDFAKYPEILLYLFNEEDYKLKPNFDVLNSTATFLKETGVKDFSEFDEKFAHLKPKFNNFEDISDKADAIKYLQATHEDKLAHLDRVIEGNNELKHIGAKRVYSSANDIVDFYYKRNHGNGLNGLSEIIDYAVKQNKIKPQSLKAISPDWNDFKYTEDKINFLLFLKNCNVSIADFNSLAGKSVISDPDTISVFANKEHLSTCLAEMKGTSKSDGFEFYKNFKDIISVIYDSYTEDLDDVRTFVELTDRFNLKNSDSVLQFYNRATGTKNKSITSEQMQSFVELFKYSDSSSLFTDAKAKNVSVEQLLASEKERFLTVKTQIEDFCTSDETGYFAGQSALDIYKKYSKSLNNADDVSIILQDIINQNIKTSEEYRERSEQIEAFSKYFENMDETFKFFADNNIKFDSTQEDETYKNNCIQIFDALYDEANKETSIERIKYFATSGFLSKSQNRLTEFLEKMPEQSVRESVLALIADKKVPSVNLLEKFFKQYKSTDTSGVELLEYLKNLPDDVDFSMNLDILNSIQTKIDELNIPIQINSENISAINAEEFIAQERITTPQISRVLDKIYSTPEGSNFISVMASNNKADKDKFSSFRIAQELASKIDKNDESYQNITRLLGLDKALLSLPYDCSHYIYAKAIETVLPKEFVDFVSSDEWMNYSDDSVKTANLVLHARLRAIDRFALNDADSIDELYTKETKTKLQDLFKSVYTTTPVDIQGSNISQRIIADFNHKSNVIEAVFTNQGEMITIVPKRNS